MQIDLWTLALQALNLGVLLLLLRWLFYRPLLAVIERRRQATAEQLARAAAARERAAAEATALAAERRALQAERDRVPADARRAAELAGAAARDAAAQAVERGLAAGREQLARERADAERALGRQAATLAGAMAREVLAGVPAAAAAAVGDAFVDAALDAVAATPAEVRAHWFDGASAGRVVTVHTAAPLDDAQAQRLQQRLRAILGEALAIEVEVDPALLAGVALRFPHATLAMHWAGALDALQADLRQPAQSPPPSPAGDG